VLLGVERDRGAGVAGGRADPGDVLAGRLLAVLGQVEADRRRLDRDLGPAGARHPGRGQPPEQADVLSGYRGGLLRVGGVLAEVVEGDQQAVVQQPARHGQRVIGGVAGHEPGDDVPRQRDGGDQVTDRFAG